MKSLPTDERRTPRWFFELCHSLWGPFDLDACAAPWNHQVKRFCAAGGNLFSRPPRARRVWMNSPYSRGNLDRFIGHARDLVLRGIWERAVLLHPVDPSSQWWKRHIARPEGRVVQSQSLWNSFPPPLTEAFETVSEGLSVTQVFVEGRLPFDGPEGPAGGYPNHRRETGAMQPSAVTIFERRRLLLRGAA